MGKESFIFTILRKVALEIPLLYILNKIYLLYGISYSQLCAGLVLAAAACLVIVRLFRRVEGINAEKPD